MKYGFFFLGIFAASFCVSAENLIFNAGFELGDAGFRCVKYLRPETNPEMRYEGAVSDSSGAFDGSLSLRFPNRFAEQTGLFLPETVLLPDTEYTFSFWAKSSLDSCPVQNVVLAASTKYGWDSKTREFTVGREWKRYVHTFRTAPAKTGEPERRYGIKLAFCAAVSAPPGDLFLDNLQLNRGGERPWEPAAAIESAAVPERELFVRGKDAPRARLVTVNYSPVKRSMLRSLLLREDFRGNSPAALTSPARTVIEERCELAPGERREKTIPLPELKFGSYELSAAVDGTEGGSRNMFSLVGRYEPKEVDLFRDFCVSVNLGAGGFITPPRWGEVEKAGFRTSGPTPDEFAARLLAMGCRLVRDHDPESCFNYRRVEPEEGKFDFSIADRVVDVWTRNRIAMMAVLGASDFLNNAERRENRNSLGGLPPWLLARSEPAPTTDYFKRRGNQVYLPPLSDWRRIVAGIARNYKGKIRFYEIMNEPNLMMSAERYQEYLKSANEAIRKVDSGAKIVGICSTGDLGGSAATFFAECLKLGVLDFSDAVSFHPYHAPNLGSAESADRQIAGLREQLAAQGRPAMPLWNSEIYYLNGYHENDALNEVAGPEDVARRFLTDLGEGVGQSIAIHGYQLFRSITPNIETSTWKYNSSVPNALFVAYNALARHFEGAAPLRKFRYSGGVVCYAYRKAGVPVAALWNYSDRRGIVAELSAFQVTDLYGNPETEPRKELGPRPFYLAAGNLSEQEFLAALENLPLTQESPFASGEIARKVGDTLHVSLFNESARPQSGIAGLRGGALIARKAVRFTIPPQSRIDIGIPVEKAGDGETELLILRGGSSFALPLQVVENPLVGREIRMENAIGTLELREREIVLSLQVEDATDAGAAGERKPWETDCVELFFDTAPFVLPERHAQSYTPETFRLFITPRDERKLHALGGVRAEECKLEWRTVPRGYAFTLTVPATVPGALGFDIKINDVSQEGKMVKETVLSGGSKLYRNRCNFAIKGPLK